MYSTKNCSIHTTTHQYNIRISEHLNNDSTHTDSHTGHSDCTCSDRLSHVFIRGILRQSFNLVNIPICCIHSLLTVRLLPIVHSCLSLAYYDSLSYYTVELRLATGPSQGRPLLGLPCFSLPVPRSRYIPCCASLMNEIVCYDGFV